MDDTFDLAENGYRQTDKDCPRCGGAVFENHRGAEGKAGQSLDLRVEVCQNHAPNGDCDYYEEIGQCPECGSEDLDSDSRGPGRITGARSGRISCNECSFIHHWSE